MKLAHSVTEFATRRPRWVVAVVALVAVTFPALVIPPSLWPERFPFLYGVKVDTDPENMLNEDESVRVFHNQMKDTLALYDMVVVGVVDESHPNGVFNPGALGRIYELTEYAKTLRGAALGEADPRAGVVERDILAPSTVDSMEPGGLGTVKFEWLMPRPPATDEEALAVRDRAQRLPFLNGTLVSEDGKALALYLPLTSKDLSYRVYTKLKAKIRELGGEEKYHITGLPVAEDTFGVEMFKQMAISAPLAMAVIFILMLVFFRKLVLVVSPMIIALVSVIITMGLLVVTGRTIHIMSSMIPIFIMPIAVLDSIHILSEFFDRYQLSRDRKKTILQVMDSLFTPMLYTSLTSTAGFASLALTPIPPVQVFGVFVAIGIMAAWVLTITLIPAYVMFIPERSLAGFGLVHAAGHEEEAPRGPSGAVLAMFRRTTYHRAKWVLVITVLLAGVAVYGMSLIEINDNPTRWFKASHSIRVADRVLNRHFGGTYMAYLGLRAPADAESTAHYAEALRGRLAEWTSETGDAPPEVLPILSEFRAEIARLGQTAADKAEFLESLEEVVRNRMENATGDAQYGWEAAALFLDEERGRDEVFKRPEVLRYLADLQERLATLGVVGKSNSLADIVKTVHRELFEGAPEEYRVPDGARAVAQCLITFEGSHRPHDLYHFVTPDYRQSSVWLQLKSGDNKDMAAVVREAETFFAEVPPPLGLEHEWFGLTYINVVWQQKMVRGMLEAFAGSFLVVLLLMVVLFRSGVWGLLSMIPLTVTIGLIYGLIGLSGKYYDMPVAVLSSLTLGLAVDFAIHFLARARDVYRRDNNWPAAHDHVFGEPARAILRNVIVIAVGFLPLLAAPLVPYITVGAFLAAILFTSGAGTLFILPALMRYVAPLLFRESSRLAGYDRCATCIVFGSAVTGLTVLNVYQFTPIPTVMLAAGTTGALATITVACLAAWRFRRNTVLHSPDRPEPKGDVP